MSKSPAATLSNGSKSACTVIAVRAILFVLY
jgi:hypothetical protein